MGAVDKPKMEHACREKSATPMVKVLGHRGARGLWPENSLSGFRKAIALGVDIIELDVHQTRDGHPVVIHDASLERTTTGAGLVADHTVDELARCRLRGCEHETVATLDRVMKELAGSRVEFGIEIKTGPDAAPYTGFEHKVIEVLKRFELLERAMIISFVPQVLEAVRAAAPGINVMACIWRMPAEVLGGLTAAIRRFEQIDGCILAVQEDLLAFNEALCRRLVPPERLAVGVTNEPERLEYWLAQSVRHVSTDRPDMALDIRRRNICR